MMNHINELDQSVNYRSLSPEARLKYKWPFRVHMYSPYKLHFEILDFFHFISPMPYEEEIRQRVFNKLNSVLNKYFPRFMVKPFGSFKTGLYLPTSDIDALMEGDMEDINFKSITDVLLEEGLAKEGSINVIDKTHVPLIKYIDNETSIKVDISFNNTSGIRAIEFVQLHLRIFPNIAPLYLLIRQILIIRELGEVYSGGLGSYSLFLMLVSFFQLHPRNDARTTRANLGTLLIEFFQLYGITFCYDTTAIRVDKGGQYILKIQNNLSCLLFQRTLDIYDPFDTKYIVSKGTYRIQDIKNLFENLYHTLNNHFVLPEIVNATVQQNVKLSEGVILNEFVHMPKEVHDFRSNLYYIHQNIHKIKILSSEWVSNDQKNTRISAKKVRDHEESFVTRN